MTALNISVSKLTSFDDFMHGRWNQTDDTRLTQYLTGRAEKSYEQTAGDAIHSFIENPNLAQCEPIVDHQPAVLVNGFRLSSAVVDTCLSYRESLALPFLFEQWLPSKKVQAGGYQINLRSRVDLITPEAIRDVKTTEAALDYDRYADSFQWRYYLWLGQAYGLDTFHYDIFRWREKGQALTLNTLTLHTYPDLETDCLRLLDSFVDYLQTRNLIEHCLAKPATS